MIYTSFYFKAGKKYDGDRVRAISFKDAQRILNESGRKHMKIDGKLIAEIDACPKTNKPIWKTYREVNIWN